MYISKRAAHEHAHATFFIPQIPRNACYSPMLFCTTLVALLPIFACTDGSLSRLGSADTDLLKACGAARDPPMPPPFALEDESLDELLLFVTAVSGRLADAPPLADDGAPLDEFDLDCTEMDLMGEGRLGPSLAGRLAELAGTVRAELDMLMPRQLLILKWRRKVMFWRYVYVNVLTAA
jgi:hypothetical protein